MRAGNDLPTGAAARHKKEPQAEYALGVLGVASILRLMGPGDRVSGGWGSRPVGLMVGK